MLDILQELNARVETVVTEKDVARIERDLKPPAKGEIVLGTIYSEEARKWWALSNILHAESDAALHLARFKSDSDEEKLDHEREAMRAHYLSKLARDVFWGQVRADIGGAAWDHGKLIGLATDWQLTSGPVKSRANVLAGMLRAPGEDEDDDE